MKSIQEAYNSIYNKQDIQEDVVYEEVDVCEEAYQILIEGGMSDDDATEVVNYIYDHREDLAEVDAQLQLHENKRLAGQLGLTLLGGAAKMLGLLPKKKAVQTVLKGMPKPKVPSKLPSMQGALKANQTWGPQNVKGVTQPNFVTGSGKINQAIAGKGQPWMVRLDPVPAGRSTLPQGYLPTKPAAEVPGQMRIPGMSDRAMELSRITGQPMGGPLGLSMSGGKASMRSKGILQAQPQRRAPGLPQPPASPPTPKIDLKKAGGVTAASGLTAAAISSVDQANKTSSERNAQRAQKLAQQKAETRAASTPAPEQTGERSAAANTERQEKAKAEAEGTRRSRTQLTAAAKDFDKAFAAARASGKKEFTWRGRSYNTKIK